MAIALISLIVISGASMSFVILTRLKDVRLMSAGEFEESFEKTTPLTSDFYDHIIIPSVRFWYKSVLPAIFHSIEKIIAGLRFIISKLEKTLLDLTNYVRGKRELSSSVGESPYWSEISNYRKELEEEGEEE